MRGHFWLRDKDGGHTIRFVVVGNPMLHANLMALSFIEQELRAIKVYIAGIGIWTFSAPVTLTFIYELNPYYLEMCWKCKCELPTSRLLKVIV